jgi:hypothetical protein
MCAATIAAVDPAAPVKEITSSRGKILRAEPIAAFFEQRRAHMVGSLPEVEDQACRFTSDWSRERDGSPDRVDAMVFALTELLLGRPLGRYFQEHSLLVNGAPVEFPTFIDWVYAVAVAATDEHPRVGVLFIASSSVRDVVYPVTVLDWDLQPVDGTLFDTWLPTVFERLETLARECNPRDAAAKNAGLMIESAGVGGAILQDCVSQGRLAHDLDTRLMLPADILERVNLIESRVHGGRDIKMARPAHERLSIHQGITRNHFLHQILSFRPGAEDLETELLNALCLGILVSGSAERVRRQAKQR